MDLTSADGTHAYLTKYLTLDVVSVERLSGGYCNYSWRVKLKAHYEGQSSVVVKHAEPFTSWDRSVELGVERLGFEYKSLRMITAESSLIDENGLVSVPSVYHYDSINNVLIMQDLGLIPTLLKFMSAKPAPLVPMAALIGKELGTFIAKIHNWGRNNPTAHASLSANAVGRTAMKTLCYDTIVPKAVKSGFVGPLLTVVAAALSKEVMTSEETLVMGDFWSANVLVDAEESPTGERALRKLWIIDWESCRYGNPAADVASLAGDSYVLSRFHDRGSGETLRHWFLKSYAGLAKVDPFRVALGLGAHWIMWTTDLGWGNEQETRECVEMGTKYIHMAWERSEEWLALSLAKELVA